MSSTAISALVVAGLRKTYPELEITVVVRERFFPFFDGIENIRLKKFEIEGLHKGLIGAVRLRNELMDADVDAIADFNNSIYTRFLRRTVFPWLCKKAWVDNGREGKKLLTRKFRKIFVQQQPTVMRYCDTLRHLGFKVKPVLPSHEQMSLPEQIGSRASKKEGVWIGVAPFAAFNGKIYPLKLADRMMRILCEKYSRIFVFGRGKYEEQFAHAMELRYDNVISVIDKMSLREELNLMSYLDVVVTMDSAPMHMASLLGIRTVSIWGATHPYAGYFGYGQPEDSMIQVDMPCRPCSVNGSKPCMFGTYACMKRISPEEIASRVEKVLEKAGVI